MNVKIIDTYYLIYRAIIEKPRIKLKELAKILGLTGRGRTITTAFKYLHRLYEYKISFNPNLILRAYENSYHTAYFLKAQSRDSLSVTFQTLAKDPKISRVMFLSGMYDFFVTSRHSDLNLKKHDVSLCKKTCMYTPQFTVPHGWKNPMRDALISLSSSLLEKGKLEREREDFLPWDDIHWDIFYSMKDNVRIEFTKVAQEVDVTSDTVKKYFYQAVLPYCDISHYFFPKGYDYYDKSFIITHSNYEKDLINSLKKLPCTTYVYPLEEELALILFHEGINDLMRAFQKMEEAGVIEKYLLLVPLAQW